DVKITDDPNTSLSPAERYRLVVHTSDLTRQCMVRLPFDLPTYLLPTDKQTTQEEQIAAIDAYPIVHAGGASMSIPFFFQPFPRSTLERSCTWVDGGLRQNLPITVFDRSDGRPPRWPTSGIKLSVQPQVKAPDKAVHGDGSRTIWVDTMHISST